MQTPAQYQEQIQKQLHEFGLTPPQVELVVATVNGYGLARYAQGYADAQARQD